MNIDIRKSIYNNFKGSSVLDINNSITNAIDGEEIILPGLGVLFETMWKNIDDDIKTTILEVLKKELS